MADVSIIEIIVYGIICYAGIVGMILSAFRESTEIKKDMSITRVVWLMPSIFCAFMLASAGANVFLNDTTEVVTADYEALNSADGVVVLNSTTTTVTSNSITLMQPVWVTLHFLFFIVMLLFVVFNILSMLTKIN